MAKKKATTPKVPSRTPVKGPAGKSAPTAAKARATAGKTTKPAPAVPLATPSTPKPAKSETVTRPSKGKPARDEHSTLDAAAAGRRAAIVPEPQPAVRLKKPAGGKSRSRDGRMSSSTPPEAMPKTRLTDKQLEQFKELLLDKRTELLSDVRMLTKDALGKSRKDSSGDLSSMPIHMADIGSDNWEQDFTLGLIANERQLVREIDEALARIESKTYGVCLATHKPITVARLRAKPWAKYCIEHAQQLERRGY